MSGGETKLARQLVVDLRAAVQAWAKDRDPRRIDDFADNLISLLGATWDLADRVERLEAALADAKGSLERRVQGNANLAARIAELERKEQAMTWRGLGWGERVVVILTTPVIVPLLVAGAGLLFLFGVVEGAVRQGDRPTEVTGEARVPGSQG